MSNTPTPNLSADPETPAGASGKTGTKTELQTRPENTSAPYAQLRLWLRDLTISLILAVFVIIFLYQPVKVEGTSMLPELQDQERIFINKFVYRIEEINRKDIVVFWYPKDPSKSYIKRIIGMPGDTVEIKDGVIYLNNKRLNEPY